MPETFSERIKASKISVKIGVSVSKRPGLGGKPGLVVHRKGFEEGEERSLPAE
jgi:hypothetical protein